MQPDLSYLKKKLEEAQQLAVKAGNPNHWAKPFYSDVHMFQPGISHCFVGVNSAGNLASLSIDRADKNEKKMWSGNEPFHNSYLDEHWATNVDRVSARGSAKLQRAVQNVFRVLYGSNWSNELRTTACFNLLPVSSASFNKLPAAIRNDCIAWGLDLIQYLQPKLIIAMGRTGKDITKRGWTLELTKCSRREIESGDCMAYVNMGTLELGPNVTARLLSLPHLSNFGGDDLYSVLDEIKSRI